jgi:tetratricopeptide (TPR) repeat protein
MIEGALISLAEPGSQALSAPSAEKVSIENLSAENVLTIAGNLVDAGHFEEALVLLDRLAKDGVGGPERDFLDGMIAMARKDYARAEAMFRKILAGDPKLVRVRLELARTLFLAKRDEQADYQFRLAIAEHLPESVGRNVARFREAIRARRAWRFNLELGLAPDTNINSATDKERVELLGRPFELNEDARARSGTGLFAAADASVRLRRFHKVPLYLGAYGRAQRYGDSRFNEIYVGGESGPEFRLSGGRLRVAAAGLLRWYGGRHRVTVLGGRLHYDKILSGKTGLEGALAVRRSAYSGRDDVDGWDIEASLTANRALSPTMLGFAWASVQRSIAHDPGQSNWQGRIGLGVLKELPWGLRPQITIEGGRQVNDAPLSLFGKTRLDWRIQASASIYKRDWNVMGFAPSLRVAYTRNFSTISLYDQKRLRAEFGVAKAF